MLDDQGGMYIPLNQPRGGSQNKRLSTRGGDGASDFPAHMVVEEPINRNAH
jgi:N-acetylglucosamine-6-sulfatase